MYSHYLGWFNKLFSIDQMKLFVRVEEEFHVVCSEDLDLILGWYIVIVVQRLLFFVRSCFFGPNILRATLNQPNIEAGLSCTGMHNFPIHFSHRCRLSRRIG